MLTSSKLIGFIATSKPEISKHFYKEILGLTFVEESPFAIVFEAKNTTLRIQKTNHAFPPPYTSLGWEVDNIDIAVRALSESGVQFERFEGMQQDELGIWNVQGGSKVAWFKDPDENLLSLTQVP